MPSPADILSLKTDEDPDDLLRMQLAQGQGANLAGAPQPPGTPTGMPMQGPSPNVPGPLAALAPPPGKPRIKLLTPPSKPKVKPKAKKAKPRIKLKAPPTSALQSFLDTIGRTTRDA
jgi:hypothetical protein